MPEKQNVTLARETIPRHVGIIMDGNGRWAKKRFLPRVAGHRAGMENVKRIIRCASDTGIRVLTLYAFSTENWKRPKEEVAALMSLLLEYLRRELDEMHKKGVVVCTIGDIAGLPQDVQDLLNASYEKTKNNTGMILNLALNYGARTEISRAVRQIAQKCVAGDLDVCDIDDHIIADHLYTRSVPDPDLIIRTSGEQRISNFLLYQIAYSEFYFTDTYWPDFKEPQFLEALREYQTRQRRYGGLK